MGFRFRKTIKAGPVNINLSKSGIGASVGVKGARITRTAKGKTRTTVGIPGTGISYTSESSGRKGGGKYSRQTPQDPNGRKPRHTAAWIFSVFFLLSFFVYFPKFCSWVMLIVGLLLLPVPFLQRFYARYIKKPVKVILIIVFVLLSMLTLPKAEKAAPAPAPTEPTVMTEAQVETTEAPTTEAPTEAPATEALTEAPATEAAAVAEETEDTGMDYVLNKSSHRFHYPDCKSVAKIKPSNRGEFHGSRDDLINRGYKPCGNCHP